jgi:hypothetical protein
VKKHSKRTVPLCKFQPLTEGSLHYWASGIRGVILAMSLLGLLATWVEAQRALLFDPL